MNNEAVLSSIIKTQLDEVWVQNFADYEEMPYTATVDTGEIFKPLTGAGTDHGQYIGRILAGTSYFDVVPEGAIVPEDTFRVEYEYTITPLKFAKNISLTLELKEDDVIHHVFDDVVANEAFVARQSQNKNAFKVFRNGFTTYLTPDGQPLFSASHPLIKGGTQSNLQTGALSTTTLNNAITLMRTMKNQAGVLFGNYARYLLVPQALWMTAVQAVGSPLQYDTGSNAKNVFLDPMGIRPMASPFLDYDASTGEGSNSAWFVLASRHSIRRWVRQGFRSDLVQPQYSNNLSYKYVAWFREEVFAVDYAGLVGSTGV